MKTLKCSDLGGAGCDFQATGNTDEEVVQKMNQHATESHKELLEKMTPEQKAETEKKMKDLLAGQVGTQETQGAPGAQA